MVLNGCVVPQYISYDEVVRDSKSEDYFVRIYEDGELEGLDYNIIGEVVISGSDNVVKMIELIRKKSKEIGGDGIIDLEVNGNSVSSVSGVNGFVSPIVYDTFFIKCKVIVLKQD